MAAKNATRLGKLSGCATSVQLAFEWTNLVMTQGKTRHEANAILAEKYGISAKTIEVKSSVEKWAESAAIYLPAVGGFKQTSSTAMEVVDRERNKYLHLSQDMADKFQVGSDYCFTRFKKAVEDDNHILASEMMGELNKLALMLTRLQTVSQGATCDSGSATAITEAGENTRQQGPTFQIYLREWNKTPRIPPTNGPILQLQDIPVISEQNGTGEQNGKS